MAGVNIYTHIVQANVKKYATPFYLKTRITLASGQECSPFSPFPNI